MHLRLLATAGILLVSCKSVEVTPLAIRAGTSQAAVREEAISRWETAIGLMNEFLASPHRRTLPAGEFRLQDDGMTFVTPNGSRPIRLFHSTWGDVVILFGFRAQEREFGFVVGSQPPAQDPELDNSFFRHRDGDLYSAFDLAEVVLHETTHMVFRDGTVGFWNSLAYYLEAVFLLKSATHSAEDRPSATTGEFSRFYFTRDSPGEGGG